MAKFKVGDEVVLVDGIVGGYGGKMEVGMTGRIVHIFDRGIPPIGVYWDGFNDGHDVGGHCPAGTGWCVYERDLELKTISLENE